MPYAKGFERHMPTPKRDCKEPLDRRIHHHSSPHNEEFPALTTLKIPDHLKSWDQLWGEEGDQVLSSVMGFDCTERKTHGYHPLESECIYDGLQLRNGLSLQIMPRHYLKQNMSSVIRVAK